MTYERFYYRNFLIQKCYDKHLQNTYYTVYNESYVHVHCKTLETAKYLIDSALRLREGYFIDGSKKFRNKVLRLAFTGNFKKN